MLDSSENDNGISVNKKMQLHNECMKIALINLKSAQAALILAAASIQINTNQMATKRIDECIEMLKGYDK